MGGSKFLRAIAVVAMAGTFTAAQPVKADMAAIGIGLAQTGCAALARAETVSVYHQDPQAGIELYYAAFWGCLMGR